MEVRKLAKKRNTILLLVGIIAASITFDNVRRDFFRESTADHVTVNGTFGAKPIKEDSQETTTPFSPEDNAEDTTEPETVQSPGSSEFLIPESQLSQGMLIISDPQHPITETAGDNAVNLSGYGNGLYTVADSSAVLDAEAADALNNMMNDYFSASQIADIVVYGTTATYTGEGSPCTRYFPESITGKCIDMAVMYNNQAIQYDGNDIEGWIIENCHKYGFIVRYPEGKEEYTGETYCPWHLRYVGRVHAEVMKSRKFCLEEYVEFIKDFDFDKPLVYNMDSTICRIYGTEAQSGETPARVPVSGSYTISGNNIDSYIVTIIGT